jgi:hypothetical protein
MVITDQVLRHPLMHRPPHDGSGRQVHPDRERQPTLVSPDRADITDPFLMGSRHTNSRLNQIGGDGLGVGRVRRNLERLGLNRLQIQSPHASGHTVRATPGALIVSRLTRGTP